MASIPADSKAFIKPFEGTDVTCLIIDVVAWFGADEIVSILNQNAHSNLKHLPQSQKAMWRQLESQVQSDKLFVSSLGVRMLIGGAQNNNHHHYDAASVLDTASPSRTAAACHNQTRFDISRALHKLGNIFIDEAVYDARAYPQIDQVNSKINRIYEILVLRENPLNPIVVN